MSLKRRSDKSFEYGIMCTFDLESVKKKIVLSPIEDFMIIALLSPVSKVTLNLKYFVSQSVHLGFHSLVMVGSLCLLESTQ